MELAMASSANLADPDLLKSSFSSDSPLVLAGAGKMGGAMLSGWLASGLNPKAVRVVDPAPPADSAAMMEKAHISARAEIPAALGARVLVMAVKPQIINEVSASLKPLVGPGTIVLSIAAGTKLATLINGLGATRVVRAMPNTPAQIRRGVTAAIGTPALDELDRALAETLLSAIGKVAWVDDEALIDAVTAVSGSGPAYLFLLTECLAEAGVAAGLSPELAMMLARETVSGAGELLHRSAQPPEVLRQNVTSPGGTTAAALEVLMGKPGLQELMTRAVAAAKRRSEELG